MAYISLVLDLSFPARVCFSHRLSSTSLFYTGFSSFSDQLAELLFPVGKGLLLGGE